MSALKRSASEALTSRPSPYHSSVTLFESSGESSSPRRSKRVKVEETIIADLEDSTLVSGSSTSTASPRKSPAKERAATTSSRKPKAIQQILAVPHPAPEKWRETYDAIKAMRARITAPVDTMGCDQAQSSEEEPKNQRFSTLVSLMLSSQTKDEVTHAAVIALRNAVGGTLSVHAVIAAEESTIQEAIGKVGFWRRKAGYIKKTAEKLRDDHASDVPKTVDELCSLPGVGPKMAFLALQIAWQLNTGIGVDVHVHRITNRLGWHRKPTKTPEETRLNLQSWLPEELRPDINHMLVGFGQVICVPVGPRCDVCTLPELGLCPSAQVAKASGSKARTRKAILMAPVSAKSSGPKVEITLDTESELVTMKPESP